MASIIPSSAQPLLKNIAFLIALLAFFHPTLPAIAHEGHGDEEIGEYDLDAPRTVSDETAKHIGLQTAEVGSEPIEEIVKISGIVKHKPDQKEIIASRINAQIKNVNVQVGDKVKRGQNLISLSRADGTQITLRLSHLEQGIVISRYAVPGLWADQGETLLEIADYSSVYIEGQLPESLISRVVKRESERARIIPNTVTEKAIDGVVRYISPVLDPIKRTAKITVEADNPNKALRSEMWVDLAIILREEKVATVVPRSAVVIYGPMHFVFIKNGSQYQKQDINPGVINDRFVEVLDGLYPGDEVVIQGAYSLTQIKPK